MIKKILLLFLIWRSFLFIPLLISNIFIISRTNYNYTLLTHFLPPSSNLLSNFLIYPFGNFDSVYYLLIAARGYTIEAGFFPLFPLTIFLATSLIVPSAVGLEFSIQQYFVSLALVTFYYLLSLIVMHKLIKIDYKGNIAIWSIIFLLVFPTSFFYATIYSEGLFLLLTLLTFYFARKNKWLLAGIFGGLLTATRIVGIAILPALILEFLTSPRRGLAKLKILYLLLVPMGILSYTIFNYFKWGDAFYFISAQGNLQNNRSVDSIVLLPQTIFRYFKIFLTVNPTIYEFWIAIFEFGAFAFAIVMLFMAWKKKVRLSYLIFSVIAFIIPLSTGTMSGLPRYILPLFPIFIALVLVQNKVLKMLYMIISTILLVLYFALFSKGFFIA